VRHDPFHRILLSKGYNLLFDLLFGLKLHDVDCGFRCFTREAAKKIKIEYEGVPVGPEIFAKAHKEGLRIAEVPVRHFPRPKGKSVFRPWKLPIQVLRTFWSLIQLKRQLG